MQTPPLRPCSGYSAEDFEGNSIDMIFATEIDHGLGMPPLTQPVRLMVGDEQEIRGKTKDGTHLIMRVGTTPFRTLVGTYLAITCFDVTSFKEKERQLQLKTYELEAVNKRLEATNQRIEAANKRISQFAYLVSHDLQEPIRKVCSFSDLIKAAIAEGDMKTAVHASDVLHASASRARGLVTALLEYCFDTSVALNVEPINVRDEVEHAIADLSTLINEAEANVDDAIPIQLRVNADKAQFMRLVSNLVTNAVKFHKANERPEIVISASTQERGDGVSLSIKDNGVGFEPRYKEAIFEPFVRLHSATQIPGNGIGLAAVKSICDRHGWNVEAESCPGQGAVFSVHIPTREPPKAVPEAA